MSAKKDDMLDKFDITTSGSLLEDIKKVDIKMSELPEIEVREVVIKETGNFLNLRENIINIPIEMIVFPFFTPQKQNKRVNFQYSFEDLGVTMYCTLVAKDAKDKVFQPSIFEEKIYTYLIAMYEIKSDTNDTDEYIEFEISDFIVNFLGNKMNRNYYSKVEQALKNLKNTEYQFVVSNHTKLGKYKFEDEEFKLLTYQKLKKGKKVYYRVTLNKNIRLKIKDKRYIKYNSKALLEILAKDPIAGRIYKYISKVRYEKGQDVINLRTLAAIIPLKTEQVTERKNKNGESKIYVLSRMKQVLKRIEKAFDILKELGYIERYKSVEEKREDTYYIHYKFNPEKDGTCHISTFIETKKKSLPSAVVWDEDADKQPKKRSETKKNIAREEILEAEIVEEPMKKPQETKRRPKRKMEMKHVDTYDDLSEGVVEKIFKAKRNIYVSKAWNKRVDNKIRKIAREDGDELAVEILESLYKRLNTEIKSTLVQYINGILKNMRKKEEGTLIKSSKQNLTLFSHGAKEKPLTSKKKIKNARKNLKKPTISSVKDIMDSPVPARQKDPLLEFDKFDDYQKLKIEEKALKLCSEGESIDVNFLLTLKSKSKTIYLNTIKKYLVQALED
ncbi:chromosomal replication initiator protein DnaA [Propionigenium maris DSM 9537]|uniref:Chromosomal replication initiator protein DnaA n=1 Tax=Propionigenium maris DSM 9537 TaxID=1123000 RepID=A0A9W6LQ06_9FUSO|nr:replication initiator protein A [Propionigenium maris]GLI58277.1 chromosomal replication initiator protein DnaA [Propionigenium maris DSM 9537]